MKSNNLENKSGWMIGGGVLAAIMASMCCIGPLLLTLLGVSGAAVLSKFEFLRVPMIGLVAILFLLAGIALFRKRKSCEPGSICADPKQYRKMVIGYWVGLMVAILAMTSTEWVIWFF